MLDVAGLVGMPVQSTTTVLSGLSGGSVRAESLNNHRRGQAVDQVRPTSLSQSMSVQMRGVAHCEHRHRTVRGSHGAQSGDQSSSQDVGSPASGADEAEHGSDPDTDEDAVERAEPGDPVLPGVLLTGDTESSPRHQRFEASSGALLVLPPRTAMFR